MAAPAVIGQCCLVVVWISVVCESIYHLSDSSNGEYVRSCGHGRVSLVILDDNENIHASLFSSGHLMAVCIAIMQRSRVNLLFNFL